MTARAEETRRRLAPALAALNGARVLVTGGSGFIGTNLIEALATHANVLNLDVAPPRAAHQARHWHETDICDRRRLHDEVAAFRPDIVFHAAARTDLAGKRIEDYASNIAGTDSLLDALAATGFSGSAVFFSSMLTSRPGMTTLRLGEGYPDTRYGESKLRMEEHVRAAGPGYRHYVVRPTSIWGPWFGTPYRDFFRMVLGRRYFNPGPRTATKTFGFVSNTVYQVLTLVASRAFDATPIYLGDATPVSVAAWANEIAQLAGVPAPPTLPEAVASLAARIGDLAERAGIRTPLTSRRLINMRRDNIVELSPIMALAPSPPFTRAEGIRMTLEWMGAGAR